MDFNEISYTALSWH